MTANDTAAQAGLPEGFVYVDELIPDLTVDLKYCSADNFVGEPVDGYHRRRVIASVPAARALVAVRDELSLFGLGLRIFDAYRPQRAVDHFIRWAANEGDTRTRDDFYPGRRKQQLFDEGYIARRSSHSRGSTFDLTLEARPECQPLDMGTAFDFFGPESWPQWADASRAQKHNRMLLRGVMGKHGFEPHDYEWWHFTLAAEPWPETYFDFPVA